MPNEIATQNPAGSSERLQKNYMRPRRQGGERREPSEFEERVIEVRRVSRTVKGGRRIRFRALVLLGNKKGKIGVGMAKANDVAEAVKKAVSHAKKKMIIVPVIDGTIPYEVTAKYGSAVVMLKPAASGTSIVAGGSVRAAAELAGITDLISKMMGSNSKLNNILATIKALSSFSEEYVERIKKYSENKKPIAPVAKEVEKAVEADTKTPEIPQTPKSPKVKKEKSPSAKATGDANAKKPAAKKTAKK